MVAWVKDFSDTYHASTGVYVAYPPHLALTLTLSLLQLPWSAHYLKHGELG